MEVREACAAYVVAAEQRVPQGYKQTEVGVIPEDWEVKQIGDLHPFVTSGSRGWAAFYAEHGEPFIRITNLSRDSIYLNLNDLRFVSLPANNNEGVRTQLQVSDVLISITADIGIVGYVSEHIPRPAYINQHIALVRFDPSKTNAKFISYFLASETPQKLFCALADSGAKAGMNLTTVKQIRLATPPIKAEQEAIAEALSDADALIESLDRLIAKKRLVKQGAMQELLRPKDGWLIQRLGSVFHLSAGHSKAGNLKQTGRFIVMDMGSVSSDGKTLSSKRTDLEEDILACGDLVMPKDDIGGGQIIGKVAYIDRDGGYVLGDHAYRLQRTDFSINSHFFYFLINSHYVNQELKKRVAGSAQLGLGRTSVLEQSLKFPANATEQTAIAATLSDMDAEIAALEEKLAKARQIKQGMMQELLTGRIRLV